MVSLRSLLLVASAVSAAAFMGHMPMRTTTSIAVSSPASITMIVS